MSSLGVHLGVSISSAPGAAVPSVDQLVTWCRELAVSVVELDVGVIETWLDAPTPIVPLELPGEDGVSTGLLELEEDVLRDSYELARTTHEAQLRVWRASVVLSPLSEFRRTFDSEGVNIAVVAWDDLARATDQEIDYAFNLAKALGAGALSTIFSTGTARRLAPVADRHGLAMSLSNNEAISGPDLESAFGHGTLVRAGIDLGDWTSGGHASPVDFLGRHADRITHVRVSDRDVDHGPRVPLGEGEAPIKEVLQTMRGRGWPFPAIVGVDYPIPAGSNRAREARRAIEYCRRCLAG